MITEDYVSFEIAKLLKENGYNGDFNGYYNSAGILISIPNAVLEQHGYVFYYRPSIALAMKWLREEKGIAVVPILSSVLDNEKFLWDVKIVVAETYDSYHQGWTYESYEQACEAAIKYCLENLI